MTGAAVAPGEVRAVAARLAATAAAADELARAWAALGSPRWAGPAADAARARMIHFSRPLGHYATLLRAVSGALVVHASVLDEARLHLARADELEHDARRRAADDRTFVEPGLPPFSPATPLYEPTEGPGAAIAAALRGSAEAMIEQSGLRTAALLAGLEVPTAPPPFHPRDLELEERGRHLEEMDGRGAPGAEDAPLSAGAVGASVRRRAQNPEDTQARIRAFTDEHGAEPAGIGMDALGLVPVVGIPVDLVHIGFDTLRGDTEAVAWGVAGLVPGIGDAAQATRLAGRLSEATEQATESAIRSVEALDRAHRIDDYGQKAARLITAEPAGHGLVAPDAVHDAALRQAAGEGGVLPSDRPAWALVTSPTARWRPVPGSFAPSPRFLRGGSASRWEADVEVEQGGRVVRYAVRVTDEGALLGEPRRLSSRPLPPDVGRPRRAWSPADEEGRPAVVRPEHAQAHPPAVKPSGEQVSPVAVRAGDEQARPGAARPADEQVPPAVVAGDEQASPPAVRAGAGRAR